MHNPWLELIELNPPQTSYILEKDQTDLAKFDAKVGADAKVISSSIPEPFIGNPNSAKLVLLNLNPGHSAIDGSWHKNPAFRTAMFHNLHHEAQPYPFYPLNPAFVGNGAGEWWGPRTSKLRDATGLKLSQFAERLLVIEWFPYHSVRSALPNKPVCESQRYSFDLARRLRKDGVLVVGMRAQKRWEAVLGVGPDEIPFLSNPQCGSVTPGNTKGKLFADMVQALLG